MNNPSLKKFKRSSITLAMATVLPFGAAVAQESQQLPTAKATAQTEESYKVDNSTSVKYTQPLLDTAKTITVIPQSMMKDRNVDSLQDALRGVPGISLAAGEGGAPPGDSMNIRGFSATNSILVDGVRDVSGYYRDTYNVEAIEVVKGPSSAMYGRGSAGGIINLQSKTAKLEEFTDVSLRLGTESDYRAQLDTNIMVGNDTAIRVNVLADDADVAGRDEVFNSKQAIAGSLVTNIDSDSRLTVNAEYQEQDNMPDYGIPWVSNGSTPVAELADYVGTAPPVDFDNFYGNVYRDFEDITAKSLTIKYENDLTEETTLRAQFRTGSVERLNVVTAPRFLDNSTSTDVRLSDEKTRDTENSLTVVQLDLLTSYQLGNTTHDIVTGVELSREKFDRWNYTDVVDDNLDSTPELVDLYNPDSFVEFTGEYARTGKNSEATGDTTAIYIFDTITFDPQWELTAGLRYDIFETEYFYDQDGEDPTVTLDAEERELSWNVGLVYKPAPNGSVYFGAGNSFTPSAESLTVSTRSNAADLDPEKIVSYELGTKWELFDGLVFANAAIFRSEKTNAISDDPDFDGDALNGEQRVDGLELGIVGQITDELQVSAAYTFQDSEVISATGEDVEQIGNELPSTPENSFSLWASYDLTDAIQFGLGTQYMDERYNSASTSGREIADDYWLFDMMVSYQVNEKLNLQLNGTNLTDEDYIDQLGGGHFVPGEGRYFGLNASYSF
ncbi:TonB-dependent siderophore receptor [Alteromonas sp. 1_MG-2023]|uniref:TonB-dependent receptor n=1 Tax=Alteromonas sp. 1_MG-2023 TaxID=3062669 RepID=UPI0026E46C69|nr:TonB-dependent siderophore receptor [Alteromonas sp. 1_MG-2023]MDO6567706.1 TonB-dependent siderophore receptor [Alteromonas sp. 1_MG-2023]